MNIFTNGYTVPISHPDKVLWPGEGITKRDLVEYYQRIAPVILPYLKDRPLNLLRHPNGIDKPGFFQKDVREGLPEWVQTIELHSESRDRMVQHVICNEAATLAWLNNLGCIELNPWNSRLGRLDRPDYLVIDLDPADNTFEEVVEVALAVCQVLDGAGLPSYPKTSGSSGLHIYIPMGARYTYTEAAPLAEAIAKRVHSRLPALTSMERAVAKRPKQIYLDYLQNHQSQTLACAYCVRPKPGATVSTPLEWSEVKPGLSPKQFTITTIFDWIEKKGDLFRPVLGEGIDLRNALAALGVPEE